MKLDSISSKRGISEVVTSIIVILLVLVALGIIWGVLSGLLNKAKIETEQTGACIGTIVNVDRAIAVSLDSDIKEAYNITLTRTASGTKDSISEVALIFYDSAGVSKNVRKTLVTPLKQLDGATVTVTMVELGDDPITTVFRKKVEVVPVISGNLCSKTGEKEIDS